MMRTFAAAVLLIFSYFNFVSASPFICEGVSTHDIKNEKGQVIIKKGRTVGPFSMCSKEQGDILFFEKGGGFYSAKEINLTNCGINTKSSSKKYCDFVVFRSKIPKIELKLYDANVMIRSIAGLSLCFTCASDAAWAYVYEPESECAKLVSHAFKGSYKAIKALDNYQSSPCADLEPSPEKELNEVSASKKASQFCKGVLIKKPFNIYGLEPDKDVGPWCDAMLTEQQSKSVLEICSIGERCQIEGVVVKWEEPYWVSINVVKKD
jgi:hypothetical protein